MNYKKYNITNFFFCQYVNKTKNAIFDLKYCKTAADTKRSAAILQKFIKGRFRMKNRL